jgi:predicted transcriptional regulator of viral defense system
MSRTPLLERLRVQLDRSAVVHASELRELGIHHQILRRAVDRGLLTKVDRGMYLASGRPLDLEQRIILACKRVPHGVICLESALRFHRILPSGCDVIWMAIDHRARKPIVKGMQMRFVRFSGDALTQGVINTRVDGVPVRVYSVAKTVADCLKYRNKIGVDVAMHNLRESVDQKNCSRERLWHFAKICRVEKLVRLAYASGSSWYDDARIPQLFVENR